MTECNSELKRVVELTAVVNAAMVDSYEDVGRSRQNYTHWAARGLKLLYNQQIPRKVRRAIIVINKNTHSAVLPDDFDTETFVGIINNKGRKVPLAHNTDITIHPNHFDVLPKQGNSCAKCGQDLDICEELETTETVETVIINALPYELTSSKSLYPNGDYYLITTTPFLDIETNTVSFREERQFIANLDRKECGCLETTKDNLFSLKECNSDVYTCYYAPCEGKTSAAGYKIFPDQNIIQFDRDFPHDKAYIEYHAFLQKSGGKYWVPEVAFETLVEWTKFKAIDGKKNVRRGDVEWRWGQYLNAKRNMAKSMGRFSFSELVTLIGMSPKFD